MVGPAEATTAEAETACEVGRLLAQRGTLVITGGRGGVMEAACRGAREGGGVTLGILPGEDRTAANEYVDVAVATGLGELRNGLIVRAADALIAVGGAYGTLTEVALALRTGTPVIGLATWTLERAGMPDTSIRPAASPAEAVELALASL